MEPGEELEILEASCQAKTLLEFTQLFAEAIQQKNNLYGSSYFMLNYLKDHLVQASTTMPEISHNEPLAIPLHNNKNPLVYALITDKPYFVRSPANLSEAGEAYQRITQALPSQMAILCYPVVLKNNGDVHGVFVFIAADHVLKKIQNSEQQNSLLHIFSYVLGLHNITEKRDKEKDFLKMDFEQKTASNYIKTVQQQIARRLIGETPVIQEVWDLLARAAVSEMAIMLRGETGAGKDLAASLIHQYSNRADGPFIVVNCAAIPENLLESELFGHCKGAFTGANNDKPGMIALADKGTLFLDEIGDLSPLLQAKMLRVLQEKKYIPIGGKKEIFSDFRIITATHRPLEKWVKEEKFRQDLFYRINQFCITIPKLSERRDDIPKMVSHFINEYMQENNTHISGCSKSALRFLQQYEFPGNVRELRSLVFQACLFVDGKDKTISKKNIQERLANVTVFEDMDSTTNIDNIDLATNSLTKACEAFEQEMIRRALLEAGGSRSKAAIRLDIPKRTLAYKCKKMESSHIEN